MLFKKTKPRAGEMVQGLALAALLQDLGLIPSYDIGAQYIYI